MELLLGAGARLGKLRTSALFDAVRRAVAPEHVRLLTMGEAERDFLDLKSRSALDLAWEENKFALVEALALQGVKLVVHRSSAAFELCLGRFSRVQPQAIFLQSNHFLL